jgi:hypothetical protein
MKTEKFIWLAAIAAITPTLIVGILILVERKMAQRKPPTPQTVSRSH